MIKKSKRLNKAVFDEVFKEGKAFSTKFFVVKKKDIKQDLPSAFAVSVSKKVAKTAVLRNKTRRCVYGLLNKHSPFEGVLAIFLPKKEIFLAETKDISLDIKNFWEKLKVRVN